MIIKKQNLYNNLLGFLIKKGNKIGAKKVIHDAFFKLSKQTGLSNQRLLLKLFKTLNTFVEIKKVRKKRSFHLVPFSITPKRRSYLAIKWLMQAVYQDSRRISTGEKLFDEIKTTLLTRSSKSLKIRGHNISQALLNRSNIHFRW